MGALAAAVVVVDFECAPLRCAALFCFAAATERGRWAAKGGGGNDESSARPQVRGRATLLKPPIRPSTRYVLLLRANWCPPRMQLWR
jgi:hypothetical protein